MEIGLTGAPSSGKSTFFKASTLIDVKIASYPFTTIDPNVGMTFVTSHCPVDFTDKTNKCKPRSGMCVNGLRYTPVKLWDVAGLVPGAHEGKGMGNQFLDNLRQASVMIHVLDVSGRTDAEGNETSGYDPINTIKFLENEIDSWFAAILKKNWRDIKAKTRQEFVDVMLKTFSGIGIRSQEIDNSISRSQLDPTKPQFWLLDDINRFASILRNMSKPIIIAANKIDLPQSQENYERIKKEFPEMTIIPCSGDAELALRGANERGLIKYAPGADDFEVVGVLNAAQNKALEHIRNNVLKKYGSTGIQKILNIAVFDILNNIIAYPVEDENKMADAKGNILPDSVILKRGSTPKELAFKVHTTMGEKFITAVNAKTKRTISGDYEVQNGDVIKIVFGKS